MYTSKSMIEMFHMITQFSKVQISIGHRMNACTMFTPGLAKTSQFFVQLVF